MSITALFYMFSYILTYDLHVYINIYTVNQGMAYQKGNNLYRMSPYVKFCVFSTRDNYGCTTIPKLKRLVYFQNILSRATPPAVWYTCIKIGIDKIVWYSKVDDDNDDE